MVTHHGLDRSELSACQGMAKGPMAAAALLALVGLQATHAFYLPGVAPRAFKDGEEVNLKVQTLVSTETPLQFDYYQLPFCKPRQVVDLPENLGEALMGERGHTSKYRAQMKVNKYCQTLCRKKYTQAEMEELQDFAILDYRVNMRLDSLPLAEMVTLVDEDTGVNLQTYTLGYPVGYYPPQPLTALLSTLSATLRNPLSFFQAPPDHSANTQPSSTTQLAEASLRGARHKGTTRTRTRTRTSSTTT
jgi:hypothetical protein